MIRFTAGNLTNSRHLESTVSVVSGAENIATTENLMNPGEAISVKDFEKIKVIGRGAFAKVYLVKKIGTNKYYAMKILKKK